MAIGVRNVIVTQPTPLIVFGGGIANKQSDRLKDVGTLLKENLHIVEPPEIRLSAFGESAGTVGALALARLV
jgi:predicted NBD/HSP70 family sugar kinase